MTLDMTTGLDHLIVLLPETVLSAGALVILLADVWQRGDTEDQSAPWVGSASVATVLLAAAANLALLAFEGPGPEAMMAVDTFRVVANLVLLAAALFGLLFSFDYLEREDLNRGEYHALLLLATVGMMVLAGARDLIVVFLGVELMSLAAYVLTAFDRDDPRSSEAGLKYFLVGAFASAFLLYGIALLYGAVGSTNLASVAPAVAEGAGTGNPLLIAGVGLLLVGLAYKVSAVPFHMWTPDAYEGAPAPVTGFMAAGVKAAAFLAVLRVVTVDLAPAISTWGPAVWWIAVLSMVVANLVALAQDDVKRMLAYSSVAHAGYILVGVAAGTGLGRAATLFYLAVYTLMTLGAFAVVYHVAGEGNRRSTLDDYAGLGWERPALGFAMLVFLLSLAGFPPTGGFVAKLYLLRASVDAGLVTLAVVLVLTTVVSYFYYLRVVWKMYFEEAPEGLASTEGPGRGFRWAAAACVVGILVAGLLPGRGIDAAGEATDALVDAPPPAAAAAPPRAAAEDGLTGIPEALDPRSGGGRR